ncbi:2OG-Fe dioxygenase family protein [Pendulispora brunnea]|uniref:2OG-Fe dioxygenase family protein n=1 Tax=Pendulispora brunnea TaxID=2905690 RepID=A0ABZ2KLV2_9BACT
MTPFEVFRLDEWGLDLESLMGEFRSTFDELEWDHYDVVYRRVALMKSLLPHHAEELDAFHRDVFHGKRPLGEPVPFEASLDSADRARLFDIRPARRRAISKFVLDRDGDTWSSRRISMGAFTQNTDDFRCLPRMFAPMNAAFCDSDPLRRLLHGVADLVRRVREGARVLEMIIHQMSSVARQGASASNAPEGAHQDGVDYVVSALVIERHGIEGGESRILSGEPQRCIFNRTLLPGEGVFHADRDSGLWHDVTPIHVTEPHADGLGKRNLFGIDINVIE